jgi:hypothetical protein
MTKMILPFRVPRSPLSCVWVQTGNPARPLECMWVDRRLKGGALPRRARHPRDRRYLA